jgi:hypothetical protein
MKGAVMKGFVVDASIGIAWVHPAHRSGGNG